MKYILILCALVWGLSSCQSTHNNSMIVAAEKLMQERPDSALTLLQSINQHSLRGGKRKAQFALLYSQALDKNYIDETNDSLIRVAVDYYSKQEASKEKFLSLYYLGRIQSNAGRYTQAMLSYVGATPLIKTLNDDYWAGLLYTEMSRIYAQQYDYSHSLQAAKTAYDHFAKTGYDTHRNYALLDVGLAYSNEYRYDKSTEIMQDVLQLAEKSTDTVLWASCLSNYALQYVEIKEYSKARKALLEKSSDLHQPLDTRDLACLAYVCSMYEKQDSTQLYLQEAGMAAMDSADSTILRFRKFQIYRHQRNYADALSNLEECMQIEDSIFRQALRHSVVSAQRDYYQTQLDVTAYKLIRNKRILTISIIFFILVVILLALYLRWRIRFKNMEIERLMNMTYEIRNALQIRDTKMSYLVQQLFKDKFEFIDKLGCTYYERQNTPVEQESIFNDVKKAIHNLGQDKRTKAELECVVNACNDDLLLKIREQLPQLKEGDYELLCYLCAGFSTRVICIFMQDKIENIYNRKSRLKIRIANSDAADKELFLKFML